MLNMHHFIIATYQDTNGCYNTISLAFVTVLEHNYTVTRT